MKSKQLKREEALVRLASSSYENSKMKRLGKGTQTEWLANKCKALGIKPE